MHSMQTEPADVHDSQDDTFDWEHLDLEGAAVRAALVRGARMRQEDRQFRNPIAMCGMQRVMSLWTALRPGSATYEKAPPVRVLRTAWRDLARDHAFTPCLETFMADWVADSLESRV